MTIDKVDTTAQLWGKPPSRSLPGADIRSALRCRIRDRDDIVPTRTSFCSASAVKATQISAGLVGIPTLSLHRGKHGTDES
jgi:hypothetical protein